MLLVLVATLWTTLPWGGRAFRFTSPQSFRASGGGTSRRPTPLARARSRLRAALTEPGFPSQGECLEYRWRQTDRWILVEVPLPRRASVEQVQLAVAPDSLQLAVDQVVAPELSPVAGSLVGRVAPESVDHHVVACGPGEHSLVIRMAKDPPEGTSELWSGFLRREVPTPTRRFKRLGDEYAWTQTAADLTLTLAVPADTTSQEVHLDFGADGLRWQLSFDNYPSFGKWTPRLWGRIDPTQSTWFLDHEPDGTGCSTFELCLAKKPPLHDETPWWPALSVEEYEDVAEQRALGRAGCTFPEPWC